LPLRPNKGTVAQAGKAVKALRQVEKIFGPKLLQNPTAIL